MSQLALEVICSTYRISLLIVFLVMEFVEAGVVMIKGEATGKYIAMSANGELYTTVSKNCLLLN